MIAQLKSDLIKVSLNKIFWIFIAVYLIGFWATTELVQEFFANLQGTTPMQLARFEFPQIWEYFSYISKFLNFLPLLLVFLFISNEYSYKTLRQSVINGSSVSDIIISQQIMIVLLSLFCTLVTGSFIIYNGTQNGAYDSVFDGSSYIFNYLLLTIGMFNMAMFFNHLFRGLLISLLIFLGYFLFAELAINSIILLKGWHQTDLGSFLTTFLPKTSIYELLIIDDNLLNQKVEPSFVGAIIWTIIFPLASYLLLKKRDL